MIRKTTQLNPRDVDEALHPLGHRRNDQKKGVYFLLVFFWTDTLFLCCIVRRIGSLGMLTPSASRVILAVMNGCLITTSSVCGMSLVNLWERGTYLQCQSSSLGSILLTMIHSPNQLSTAQGHWQSQLPVKSTQLQIREAPWCSTSLYPGGLFDVSLLRVRGIYGLYWHMNSSVHHPTEYRRRYWTAHIKNALHCWL